MEVFSQSAIIEDPDGYTNVREAPGTQSKVIAQIKTDEVFWVWEDYYDEKVSWVSVYIPKNKLSISSVNSPFFKGYVHKSRIGPLADKKTYDGDELFFQYETKRFSSSENLVEYEGEWVSTINGLRPFGIDGYLPNTQVSNITVTLNGKKIFVPPYLYKDLFNVENNYKIFKNDDAYFVQGWYSDGAGAFELVWVITENGVIQRLAGTIY